MAVEIARVTDYVDDVSASWGNSLVEALAKRPVMPGRLTLQTGVAVSTTDQSAKTTLYYTLTGDNGCILPLYNGSYWQGYPLSADLSVSLAGLTASTPYDVFCYDSSGTPTLELLAWSSGTARATALALQNGLYVKSGAATRLYLGTIYINSTGGQTDDSASKRFVWNYYNRVQRLVTASQSTTNWTYAVNTAREFNGGSGQTRGEFVIGVAAGALHTRAFGRNLFLVSGGTGYVGACIDTTAPAAVGDWFQRGTVNSAAFLDQIDNFSVLGIGYHYLTQVEQAVSGTLTFSTSARNISIMLQG